MHEKGIATPWNSDSWVAERAIVLQVLRYDRPARWTRAELTAEVYDIEPGAIRMALRRLERHGVVCFDRRPCVNYINWTRT